MDQWEFAFDPPPNPPRQPITGDDYFETTDFKAACELYEITQDEGKRRHNVLLAHQGDPNDPICVGCTKRSHELDEYMDAVMWEAGDATVKLTQEDYQKMSRTYVIEEEGTYNQTNGHFLCSMCYIKNGQPSSRSGWICP